LAVPSFDQQLPGLLAVAVIIGATLGMLWLFGS
jgi:hypothetical protein